MALSGRGDNEAVRTLLLNLLWLWLLQVLFFVAFARPLEAVVIAWLGLAFLSSLLGAVVYLYILGRFPRKWSHRTRRAGAVVLSPLVLAMTWWWFHFYGVDILVFLVGTIAYGLTVGLPGERTPFDKLAAALHRRRAGSSTKNA